MPVSNTWWLRDFSKSARDGPIPRRRWLLRLLALPTSQTYAAIGRRLRHCQIPNKRVMPPNSMSLTGGQQAIPARQPGVLVWTLPHGRRYRAEPGSYPVG